MVTIIFEAHGTSFDNENNLASGWNDVRLSEKGTAQAKDLGDRYRGQHFDAIFSSDLKRAYQTATIAFDFNPRLIYTDWRLRECDYGQYTQADRNEIDAQRIQHIEVPFADGESYKQCMERMGSFIADLKTIWDGKRVMVIGHRATQYGLEHFINNKTIEQCLTEPWQWQAGWEYQLQ